MRHVSKSLVAHRVAEEDLTSHDIIGLLNYKSYAVNGRYTHVPHMKELFLKIKQCDFSDYILEGRVW